MQTYLQRINRILINSRYTVNIGIKGGAILYIINVSMEELIK